jgi:hypothetical protein
VLVARVVLLELGRERIVGGERRLRARSRIRGDFGYLELSSVMWSTVEVRAGSRPDVQT